MTFGRAGVLDPVSVTSRLTERTKSWERGAGLAGRVVRKHRPLLPESRMSNRKPPARPISYDKKVGLVLQGGGALGSYQAGVYEALSSSEYPPDWVAGISIGAINAAIIAGNAPESRVERLRCFWEEITAPSSWWPPALTGPMALWQQKLGA